MNQKKDMSRYSVSHKRFSMVSVLASEALRSGVNRTQKGYFRGDKRISVKDALKDGYVRRKGMYYRSGAKKSGGYIMPKRRYIKVVRPGKKPYYKRNYCACKRAGQHAVTYKRSGPCKGVTEYCRRNRKKN